MKKLLTLLLSAILSMVAVFAVGCANEPEQGKVNIKYYSDGQAVVLALKGGSESVGLVPEPAATALGEGYYRLDLQELYDSNEKSYPQAVLMVRKSVLGAHENLVDNLQSQITESATWIKTNTSDAVLAMKGHGGTQSVPAAAIDGCNIFWQGAQDAKFSVKTYINKIVDIDATKATAVGDDFFYTSVTDGDAKSDYTFVMPDGAPALAVAKLMHDNSDLGTGKSVTYTVIPSAATTQVNAYLASGSKDFIIAPVNLASKLYKAADANDPYVMVAVLTHGNFYIMSTEEITLQDLVGKQIAVPNMGAVPDWTFKMVLAKHGIDYVTVE